MTLPAFAWRKNERTKLLRNAKRSPGDARGAALADRPHLERAFRSGARNIGVLLAVPERIRRTPSGCGLRGRGDDALPAVVAQGSARFSRMETGVELAVGTRHSYLSVRPRSTRSRAATHAGWDADGYRLGYAAAFSTYPRGARQTAASSDRLRELLEDIHPQPHDIPVDFIVSERGVYRGTEGAQVPGRPERLLFAAVLRGRDRTDTSENRRLVSTEKQPVAGLLLSSTYR